MRSIYRHSTVVLVGALALSACGKSSTTTITTNTETGATTATTTGDASSAAALGLQPGKWETTIAVVESKTKGMPDGMPNPPQPGTSKLTSCLTPEQAAKGPAEMLKNAKIDCTITTNTFAGGKLETAASCKMPNGTMTTRTTGTYSATQLDYDTEVSTAMGPINSTQKLHTSARRIGDCDAKKG